MKSLLLFLCATLPATCFNVKAADWTLVQKSGVVEFYIDLDSIEPSGSSAQAQVLQNHTDTRAPLTPNGKAYGSGIFHIEANCKRDRLSFDHGVFYSKAMAEGDVVDDVVAKEEFQPSRGSVWNVVIEVACDGPVSPAITNKTLPPECRAPIVPTKPSLAPLTALITARAKTKPDGYYRLRLQYTIDSTGSPLSVVVTKSSTDLDIDRAALEWGREVKFSPAPNCHADRYALLPMLLSP